MGEECGDGSEYNWIKLAFECRSKPEMMGMISDLIKSCRGGIGEEFISCC